YEQSLIALRRILSAKTHELQRLMNSYAWMLATAEDPKFRDPARAVELAKEVVRNPPGLAEKWTTLGVAQYRAGDLKSAIAALEKSETLAPGRYTGTNGFFLASAYWQLGDKEKARQRYAQAIEWMDKKNPTDRELLRFRSEASESLGIADAK